jgi:hypothetical protein
MKTFNVNWRQSFECKFHKEIEAKSEKEAEKIARREAKMYDLCDTQSVMPLDEPDDFNIWEEQ